MSNAQEQVETPIESLTPEAIQAEEAALKGEDKEKVRSQVIEKYGLDPDLQADLVSQLTDEALAASKTLSTAIRQKIAYREKLAKTETKPEPAPAPAKVEVKTQSPDEIQKMIDERFEKQELDSLDLGDELKSEIKKYAKLNGVSIKEASKSPYIVFMKGEAEKKAKLEEASLGSGRKTTQATQDYANTSFEDLAKQFDLSTKEGRDGFEKAKKEWIKSQ